MTPPLDVLILGAGTAGMGAYRAAAAHTDRVLLVEAERYGTTCARVGCMPSKLLIAAADAAHGATHASGFGVHTGSVRVDGRQVMARVRSERDRFVGFVVQAAEGFPAAHRRFGRARFLDAHTVAIDGEAVSARAIVIATGSRPRILPFLAGLGDRLIVNDDVFSWEDLPESVAVFGPGVIGLEIGQALARLGVRVRIFGVGGFVGPLTDPEVKEDAQRVLCDELPLHPDVHDLHVDPIEGGVRVRWDGGEDTFQYALAATGRVPNVDDLGLENTGLTLDRRGVPVYDPRTLQCGQSGIFIAGDANADLPLLHEAADEGRIAGDNAGRFPDVRPGLRRSPLSVVFTDPNIAMIGETWAQVRDRDPIVGRVSFDDQGRSRVMRQNRGRLNVYADRATGRLLGAEMMAPRGEHLAHELAWAHQMGLTIPQMLDLPFYHPVVEEGLRTALRDAARHL
jgi:dihydrolipoamide dehydrogenase